MAARRKERLADQIKDEVSRILLFDMNDPRMGFVTVTGVELTGDLKTAKVMISILGDEKTETVTMNVIKHARGFIQKELGERVTTRYMPHVTFELDESVKRSVRLSKTLKDVLEDTNGSRE